MKDLFEDQMAAEERMRAAAQRRLTRKDKLAARLQQREESWLTQARRIEAAEAALMARAARKQGRADFWAAVKSWIPGAGRLRGVQFGLPSPGHPAFGYSKFGYPKFGYPKFGRPGSKGPGSKGPRSKSLTRNGVGSPVLDLLARSLPHRWLPRWWFLGWGWVRWVISAASIAALPMTAVAGVLWVEAGPVLEDLHRRVLCAEQVPVLDAGGQVLGYADSRPEGLDCTGLSLRAAPFPKDQEQVIAEAFSVIEGGFRPDDPRVWLGHDILGIRGLFLDNRGFSAPLLTTVEAVLDKSSGISWWDKAVTAMATTRLALTELRTTEARARFIATFMPTVVNRSGRIAAEAMFGGRLPQTTAEICQLARAPHFPLELRNGPEVSPRAALRWVKSLGPGAAQCAEAIAKDPADLQQALVDLKAQCGGSDLCLSPPKFDTLSREDAEAKLEGLRLAVAQPLLPPYRPLRVPGGAELVIDDALRLSGMDQGTAPVATTLDTAMQAKLSEGLEAVLEDIDRDHKLFADSCLTGPCPDRVDHRILLAEVDDTGAAAIRVYGGNRHGALTGWVTRMATGWMAAPPKYGLASTSKALLVLVAKSNRVERLCALPTGGQSCRGGAWISLDEATAKSDSEAFAWLARRHPQDVARALVAMGHAARPDTGAVPGGETAGDPAIDAAYGIRKAAMTSADAVALFAAFTAGQGRTDLLTSGKPLAAVDLAGQGFGSNQRMQACQTLAAPLLAPGGTLEAAGRMLVNLGFQPICGKTGTHSEGGIDLVLTSTILARRDGRLWILHVALEAPERKHGLGTLHHSDLLPLQRLALSTITP